MLSLVLTRLFIVFVGVSGAFSVLFGAWLAHAASHLSPDIESRLSTALNYQILHTLALLILVVWRESTLANDNVRASGNLSRCYKIALTVSPLCFLFGIVLFSGSLYFKTLLALPEIGKAAPFGGVLFAFGWLSLVLVSVGIKGKNQ